MPPMARVEKNKLGEFDVWDFFPSNYLPTQRVVIYIHGGGGMLGGLENYEPIAREIAYFSSCRVLAIDYPLAPENPYPSQKEHLDRALEEIKGRIDLSMGFVLVGEGFSASLTLELAIKYRPELLILLVPLLDWSLSSPSASLFAKGFGLELAELEYYRSQYLQGGEDFHDVGIPPLTRKDLDQLPPCYVFTAEYDPLRDDGAMLKEKKGDVHLEMIPGMIHEFLALKEILPEVVKFYVRLGKLIRDE